MPASTLVAHFIDGQEVPSASGRTFSSINPATGDELAEIALGDATDVDRAVTAAAAAHERGEWTRLGPTERVRILRKLGELLREASPRIGAIESSDTGKPINQAISEARIAADYITYFAGHAQLPDGATYPADRGYFVYSRREPYGVVGAISPWNYPLLLATSKIAPALGTGNCVVLKVSEEAPLSVSELARLSQEAGLPDGVLNVVHGDAATGAALVAHPKVPKITFTGSTRTGQAILRASADQVKSVHLELGGKSPNIVFADADFDDAISGSLFTAFYNAGQVCTSGSRLLVHEDVADHFTSALIERARAIQLGDPRDPGTEMGPLISRRHFSRVHEFIQAGRREGARIVSGGRPLDLGAGNFIEPTIFVEVEPSMRLAQEEIFGPVLSVMTFKDEEDAVRLANGVMYGLAATVWTSDLGRAFRMAERLHAGIVWTNCPHYRQVHVPWEGHKMSGLGEDLGIEALNTFTVRKTHCIEYGGAKSQWSQPK